MGEAKKRREAMGAEVPYKDIMTEKWMTAKVGGDPEVFIKQMRSGERPTVPCGDCKECCYHKKVNVDPKIDDVEYLQTEMRDGFLVLKRREDGACVHLGDKGCTIYEHRPEICRKYDCRMFSIFGMGDTMDTGHHSPAWVFIPRDRRGRVLITAYRMAGMLGVKKAQELLGDKWEINDAITLAATVLPDIIRDVDALSQLSPEEWIETVGVDPAKVTQEDYENANRHLVEAWGLKTI